MMMMMVFWKVQTFMQVRLDIIHAKVDITLSCLYERHQNRHIFCRLYSLPSVRTQWKLVRIHAGAYPHL